MEYPQKVMDELKDLYLNDKRPWIIGFSGGKDSTGIVQMVYYMLKDLSPNKRTKEVYILSSDTLVENPLMDIWRKRVCAKIETQAKKDGLPIKVRILRPELDDSFWVNLIGRGYPSPNRWFRWCTDRLKIKPMTKYILEQVKENGEVIILLGIRKSEGSTRTQTMKRYEIENFRLRKHTTIQGAYIYAPIEDWEENEVWTYLLKVPSPWGENNRDLISFYQKGDAEIQFIIDKSVPPSGSSRFGCWVCTVVERDRALEASIEEGKAWLIPLLKFRNWLKEIRDNPHFREEVRRNDKKKKVIADTLGLEFTPTQHRGHTVLGPFTFDTRHEILRRLIILQEQLMTEDIPLISPEEIKAIETIWIYEGDNITTINDVLKSSKTDLKSSLRETDNNDWEQLSEICDERGVPIHLIKQLLMVEKDLSSLSRRTGIYNRLEKVIEEYIITEMKRGNGVGK